MTYNEWILWGLILINGIITSCQYSKTNKRLTALEQEVEELKGLNLIKAIRKQTN
jgi:hypothetical protein